MDDKRRDWELLRQFLETNSQPAFAELTRRYIGLVFATALRELGDRTQAEDVTQAVFIVLARKARTFRSDIVLAAWLFDTCKFTARHARRDETRRQLRERKIAMEMQQETERTGRRTGPIQDVALNDALTALPKADRQAVLLRFVCGYTFTEAGEAFGVSEEAARKRVDRALEKLRRTLTKSGAGLSAIAVAELVQAQAAQAVSAALEAKVAEMVFTQAAGAALAGASAHTIAQGVLKSMTLTTLKITAAVTCGLILAGGTVYQGIARAGRTGSRGAVFKGVALTRSRGFRSSAFVGNADAGNPASVKIVTTYINVASADLDKLSKLIPAGKDHDILLQKALIESGGAVVLQQTINTTDGSKARIDMSRQAPAGTTADGKPLTTAVPNSTEAIPYINANGTIKVQIALTQSELISGGPKGSVTTDSITSVHTFDDGQTCMFRLSPDPTANPTVLLAFVKVSTGPDASAAASPKVYTSLNCIDAVPASYQTASGQIPFGENHDAQLLAALKKAGAKIVTDPTLLTISGNSATVTQGDSVIYTKTVNGKDQQWLMVPSQMDFTPQINVDGTITVIIHSTKSELKPGVTPVEVSRSSKSATVTFHEGQTLLIDSLVPSKPDDTVVHLTFMTVTIAPGDPAAAAARTIDALHQSIAAEFEKAGTMSAADYLHLYTIQISWLPTGKLPDDEYGFLFALLKKPSQSPCIVEAKVFATLMDLPGIPDAQKEQTYQAALAYLSQSPNSDNSLCRLYASHLMAKLGDKRAIPYIVPLLNDPLPAVRARAMKDLKTLGYSAQTNATN